MQYTAAILTFALQEAKYYQGVGKALSRWKQTLSRWKQSITLSSAPV